MTEFPQPPMVQAGPQDMNPDQVATLLRSLDMIRVHHTNGQAHLQAWDVRRWLTRIFGFGGWSEQILSRECMYREEIAKGRWTVVYEVAVRLVLRVPDGRVLASYDGMATGDAQNQRGIGDALDMAVKTAQSQALKRAAMNLGDQFGLSLYNKGSMAPVVQGTLARPVEDKPAQVPEYEDPEVGADDVAAPVAEDVQASADGDWKDDPRRAEVAARNAWTEARDALMAVGRRKGLDDKGVEAWCIQQYGGDINQANADNLIGAAKELDASRPDIEAPPRGIPPQRTND